jgi:hypothetical protein
MTGVRASFALQIGLAVTLLTGSVGQAAGAGRDALPAAATPTTDPDLDAVAARLGGTRTTFEAAYGAPVLNDVGSGSSYDVPGYGQVLVSFLAPANAPLPDDVAVVIVLRSPRPEDAPATEPDERDWSLDEAREASERFLPRDAELADAPEAVDQERGRLVSTCRSQALAVLYPKEEEPGACRVTFLTPTAATASFVTLALGGSSSWDVAPDPCAGMSDWAPETGRRMATATATLEGIGRLDPADPDAPTQLRAAASTFTTMAQEQESSDAPMAAAETNALLVEALTAYATAIDLAATGLASGDDSVLAEAADLIAEANTLFQDADRLLLSALSACDLMPEQASSTTLTQRRPYATWPTSGGL